MPNTPNEERPRLSMNESPSIGYHIIKFGLCALCLAVAGVICIFVSRELGLLPKGNPQDEPQKAVEADATSADEKSTESDADGKQPEGSPDTSKEGEMRAKLSLAKTKQRAALTQVKEVLEALDAWEKESQQFAGTQQALLADDCGKSIAANAALFSKLRAVFDQPRPNTIRIGDLRTSSEHLKSSLEASLQDLSDASHPAEALTQELAAMVSQAAEGREAFRKANNQLDAITTIASADKAPHDETLQAALDRTRREEAEKEAAAIAHVQEKAREETAKKLVSQRQEEELEKGRLDLAERKARLEAETDERESRIKEERLWRIARSQRARELLQPAVALTPQSKTAITWQVRLLGNAFNNPATFRAYLVSDLRPHETAATIYLGGAEDPQAGALFNKRDAECKKELGMTLYELFREVALRDQESAFLTNEEVNDLLLQTPRGQLYDRLTGRANAPPPKPLPKPDWLKD